MSEPEEEMTTAEVKAMRHEKGHQLVLMAENRKQAEWRNAGGLWRLEKARKQILP